MQGYIFAILSSIFFSLYVVPRKLSKLSAVVFSLIMATGFLSGTVLIYLVFPQLHSSEQISKVLWWSVLAGIIWATAFVSFIKSIDFLGLSRSNQWKNLQGPVGVVLALTILGESSYANPLFTSLAAIAVFLSAVFFTISKGEDKKQIENKGVLLAVLSALGFGSVAVIQKFVTANSGVYTQQVIWSGSIFVCLLLYSLFKNLLAKNFLNQKKDILLAYFAGIFYLGASYFQLFSYKYIAASIGFTIIQMNALWTITIGILVFKEIEFKKYALRVIGGFLFTLIGIGLLALAK